MSKFYLANKEFAEFLESIGFIFHDRLISEDPILMREETGIDYFTHHATGKQVKIHIKENKIYLLDNEGYEVDSSSSFTDNQILKFIKN